MPDNTTFDDEEDEAPTPGQTITRVVFWTVQYHLPSALAKQGCRSVAWVFAGNDEHNAIKLHDQLSSSFVMEGYEPTEVHTSGWTVNLIAWDRHPTQNQARGLIVRQYAAEA